MNHPFTVIWIGDKFPDRRPIMQPGEADRCVCEVCESSWAEHGRPDESQWKWHKLELAEAVVEAPWGIFDPSWFHDLRDLNASEIRVFLAFASYRNGVTGESAPGVANVVALTGVSERTTRRAIAGLVRVGLLTLLRRRSGRRGEPNVYRLAPTLRHDQIMAKVAERKAATSPASSARPTASATGGARPSQDPISPPISAAEREAGERVLERIKREGFKPPDIALSASG
jgi:hypothetical protein